jgi:D-tyrosyl-tRNA(Tyr) deacylase
MKTIIQRVLSGKLEIENKIISQIEKGIVVFLGIQKGDTEKDAEALCEKILNLRIFEDKSQKMNLSLKDISGEIMIVSNFTICSSTKHGKRPSFEQASPPEIAKELYEYFCKKTNEIYAKEKVKTGEFGSEMKITIINDGPVNIIIESIEGKIK